MPEAPIVEFSPCPPGDDPARRLIAAMVGELSELSGITDGRLGVALDPAEMALPGGTFLVGYLTDAGPGRSAVAGGGLRTIGPGLGEIKRMYVVPEWRGRGVARLLLSALEEAARDLGLSRVRLDTGPGQPEARHLYETAGYREIGNYNDNPHAAYWGEKDL